MNTVYAIDSVLNLCEIIVKKPRQWLPWWLSWWRILLQCKRPWFNSWVRKFLWRRDRLPTPVFSGFPGSSVGKESACNVGDLGSILGLGRFPRGGHSKPIQYSCLENPHGQKSLVGYSAWGLKELDMTEWLSTAQHMMVLFLVFKESLCCLS